MAYTVAQVKAALNALGPEYDHLPFRVASFFEVKGPVVDMSLEPAFALAILADNCVAIYIDPKRREVERLVGLSADRIRCTFADPLADLRAHSGTQ